MTLEGFDLASLPMYNEDLEAGGFPATVVLFHGRIQAAECALIVTPEYNHSIPGVLKNAIDWASRPAKGSPLDDKPAAILGASTGMLGSVRRRPISGWSAATRTCTSWGSPEVYIGQAREKFDTSGRLTDQDTRRRVGDLLAALGAWTTRLREG